uniref:hypothetical protein n=1 Tax=Gemmiger formicilis TaxID=745368 RepID=UPI003FEE049A
MSVTSHGPPVRVWLKSVVSSMAKTGFVTATPCRRCSTVMLLLPRMTSRFAFVFQYSMLAQAAASGRWA